VDATNGSWGSIKAGPERYAEGRHNSHGKSTPVSLAVSRTSLEHRRKPTSQGSDAREEVDLEFGRAVSSAVVRKSQSQEFGTQAIDFDEKDKLDLSSSTSQRFEYFNTKLAKLQIWKDDNGQLFSRLKERAQTFMDELAEVVLN
jgi:hypothetical protein